MSTLTPNDYKTAIDVQSACNLGAVVHSFSRVMNKIQADGRGKGTDWVNKHPITRMYAEQIHFLSQSRNYHDAYTKCDKKGQANES